MFWQPYLMFQTELCLLAFHPRTLKGRSNHSFFCSSRATVISLLLSVVQLEKLSRLGVEHASCKSAEYVERMPVSQMHSSFPAKFLPCGYADTGSFHSSAAPIQPQKAEQSPNTRGTRCKSSRKRTFAGLWKKHDHRQGQKGVLPNEAKDLTRVRFELTPDYSDQEGFNSGVPEPGALDRSAILPLIGDAVVGLKNIQANISAESATKPPCSNSLS
ncbi:hypothetical protein N656DRAFT_186556 [Canariomyces notabilis]|uniref:Uncharacterized protein n=1 Tax=Canariomyces notabilis TaxID=2074819 RepID=A0AAN6TAJ1_9PEZI|nr:hypothetical protein N656DRAFT_186556 [Canariomyces arenarius]